MRSAAYLAYQMNLHRYPFVQAGGTPYVAVMGEKATPEQQRLFDALRAARNNSEQGATLVGTTPREPADLHQHP